MRSPAPQIEALPIQSPAVGDVAERARRRITRRLLPYLLLLYLIAYIDRTNIGVAKLKMLGDLKFTDEIIGFGAGIFFIGYFLLEIPGTLIVERWSARKWIARIMISWGIVATLMGFIGTPLLDFLSTRQQFYSLRFILGLAEAGFFPGVIVYLSHWFRYEDRGKAKAKFMIGIPLATVIGVPLSRLILENINWYGLPGWRWVFILEGVPSVILGIITLFYLTDRPHQAKWLPEDEREWITGELAREKQQREAAGRTSVWSALRHPQIVLLALVYFFAVTGNYGLTFFLPSIAQNMKGVSVVWQTVVTMLPYICCIIAILLLGPSSDRTGERRWHTVVPILLTGVGMGLSVVTANYLGLTVAALCLAGLAPGAWPAFWSLPSAFLTGSATAAAVGLINSIGNLGGFIGPYAVGYLKDTTGSYKAGMWFLAGCALLAGFLAMLIRPPEKTA
ncbi:MAG TPA: MFS transporter [Blastocatellia bacterium]|nr:MFS transporter [Blastocatellia bacterium]